jgi:hypothetical protein
MSTTNFFLNHLNSNTFKAFWTSHKIPGKCVFKKLIWVGKNFQQGAATSLLGVTTSNTLPTLGMQNPDPDRILGTNNVPTFQLSVVWPIYNLITSGD